MPGRRRSACPTEILAGRSADDSDKVTRRRVKVFDALSEKCVRSSHDTKTRLLKTTVEKTGAREE
jgi:hypothetical protein